MATTIEHTREHADADARLPDLVDLVRRVAAEPDRWRPHVHPHPTARTWSRLPSPAGVDLWVLTWLPDQATELHDHGDAAAALTVVQGRVREVRAARDGRLSPQLLDVGDTHVVAPGVVHDVAGAGTGPSVTVHAYSPRLRRMTFWRPTPQGLVRDRVVETAEPEVLA